MNPAYDRDELERFLLAMAWAAPDLLARARPLLDPLQFGRRHRPFARALLDWFDRHGDVPPPEAAATFAGVRADDYRLDLTGLDASRQAALERWFLETVEDFTRRADFARLLQEAAAALDDGDVEAFAHRFMEVATRRIDDDPGLDPFADPAAVVETLKTRSGTVSTGWRSLDERLHGGFRRGELVLFLGLPGAGKSLFLQNVALNAVRRGLAVVYVTLELSAELCAVRLCAMAAGVDTPTVMRDPDRLAPEGGDGPLRIKYLPNGSTPLDLEAHLRLLETRHGLAPDLLVVDYLDELEPTVRRLDAIQPWVRDKLVAREVRDLAVRRGLVLVTATQLNRSAVDETDLRMDHVGGGLTKIHVADVALAIRTSAALREEGAYELTLIKTRSSSGVGSRLRLAFDPATLRISDGGVAPVDHRRARPLDDPPEPRGGFRLGDFV